MADERMESHPHTRLTRICDAMMDAVELHPENGSDVRIIVFMQDDNEGGAVFHGYEDAGDMVVDALLQVRSLLRTMGRDIQFYPMGGEADWN